MRAAPFLFFVFCSLSLSAQLTHEAAIWRGFEFKFKYTNHRIRQFGQFVTFDKGCDIIKVSNLSGTGIGKDKVVYHNHATYISDPNVIFQETVVDFYFTGSDNQPISLAQNVNFDTPPNYQNLDYNYFVFLNGFTLEFDESQPCRTSRKTKSKNRLAALCAGLRFKKMKNAAGIKKIKAFHIDIDAVSYSTGINVPVNAGLTMTCDGAKECETDCAVNYRLKVYLILVKCPKEYTVKDLSYAKQDSWNAMDNVNYPKSYSVDKAFGGTNEVIGITELDFKQNGPNINHFQWWSSFIGVNDIAQPFEGAILGPDIDNGFKPKRNHAWDFHLNTATPPGKLPNHLTIGLAFYPWHKARLGGKCKICTYGRYGSFTAGSHAKAGSSEMRISGKAISFAKTAEVTHFTTISFSKSWPHGTILPFQPISVHGKNLNGSCNGVDLSKIKGSAILGYLKKNGLSRFPYFGTP